MPRNPKPKCRKCKSRPVSKAGQLCTVCRKPKKRSSSRGSRRLSRAHISSILSRSSYPAANGAYYAQSREEKLSLLRQLEPHACATKKLIGVIQNPEIDLDTRCVA